MLQSYLPVIVFVSLGIIVATLAGGVLASLVAARREQSAAGNAPRR